MSIINKIKKVFTGGDWFIAYQNVNDQEWSIAKAPENQWCADPFVFEDGDEHYIFVEQYRKDKDKGCIGYFKFVDGIPVNEGIIIENSYHMSYPDVFKYKDQYYMIPESSANNTVDLYIADSFPDKWHKEKTLIDNGKYVDSTVYQDDTGIYLISYTMTNGYDLHVFSLDMGKKELTEISIKHYQKNIARPGGRLFLKDGKLIRPAQDCSKKYGEALILYQVDSMNKNGEYVEHEVNRISMSELKIQSRPERIHHITRAGKYEVIDCYKEKLDIFHVPRIYLRSRRK